MLKYNNMGSMIDIALDGNHSNYSVMIMYMPYSLTGIIDEISQEDEEIYLLNMWLKYKDIEDVIPIDMQRIGGAEIEATKNTIKKKLCRYIYQIHNRGDLDYYIDRFEYYCRCFEIGNDILEKEGN